MARVYEAREICERALRKIGSYSINDTGASASAMAEARWWLDMVLGHVSARQRCWWMVEDTAEFSLTAGEADYLLSAALPNAPSAQAVVGLWIIRAGDGTSEPLKIVRRQEWEGRRTTSGDPPEIAYIDRTGEPTLRVNPIPADPSSYQLRVVYQSIAPDVRTGDPNAKLAKWRAAWNLWIVTALAAEIGDGPVRKLPGDEVRAMRSDAAKLLAELDAYDAHEQADEPRRIEYHDF